MIKLGKRRNPGDPSDSGALNDLSFLLIVFFIVIAGFNVNKGFLMNLPDASRPRIVQMQDLMKCSIDQDGIISLDGVTVSAAELEKKIKDKKNHYPNMTFLLSIHPQTKWQNVVFIIHEIRKLDVENFSFRMDEGALE